MAFDAGPGNALIDQWMHDMAGVAYDQNGDVAALGHIDHTISDKYLSSAFFDQKGAKSLDRLDFPTLASGSAKLSDGARTLSYVTAKSIHRSAEQFPQTPRNWIVCGGGRLNRVIMADLRELVGAQDGLVKSAEDVNLNGDMLEAEAFAYLAVRSSLGLPLTYQETTGCSEPVTGGVLARAQ